MHFHEKKEIDETQQDLHGLFRSWGRKQRGITKLAGKIGEIEQASSMKPSLFRRLTKWLGQIALLRRKEEDLISRITSVEKRHRELRLQRKLNLVTPAPTGEPETSFRDLDNEKASRWRWLMWALLLYWMLRPSNKRKAAPTPLQR